MQVNVQVNVLLITDMLAYLFILIKGIISLVMS